MTPDLWWILGAGLVTGAVTLLFACLQVAGAASDAADRALARGLIVGMNLPMRRSFSLDATPGGNRHGL